MNQTVFNVCLGVVVAALAAHHIYTIAVLNEMAVNLDLYLSSRDPEYNSRSTKKV